MINLNFIKIILEVFLQEKKARGEESIQDLLTKSWPGVFRSRSGVESPYMESYSSESESGERQAGKAGVLGRGRDGGVLRAQGEKGKAGNLEPHGATEGACVK